MNERRCQVCGQPNIADPKMPFCENCGDYLPQQKAVGSALLEAFCPGDGKQFVLGANFCHFCGRLRRVLHPEELHVISS